MLLSKELTDNAKKMKGLSYLGIESTIISDNLIIHTDIPPDDKAIMDAYAEYEAEQNPSRIDKITLSIDKTTIIANGIDTAIVTTIFEGKDIETFNCYITINGPPAEIIQLPVEGTITREFTSETIGTYKIEFFADNIVKSIFIEAVAEEVII